MRYAAMLLVLFVTALSFEPVHASSETDSMAQECRRVAKRNGTIGDRVRMSTLISVVKAAEHEDDDHLDLAMIKLQKFCHELSQREPLR